GPGVAVLETLAVHVQPHAQVLRVGDFVGRHQPGADGTEGIATLALVPGAAALHLVFALGHIVHHAIAGDIIQGLVLAHIARLAADDHAQLDFPVGLVRTARDDDGVVGAGGRRPFVEQYGFLGYV